MALSFVAALGSHSRGAVLAMGAPAFLADEAARVLEADLGGVNDTSASYFWDGRDGDGRRVASGVYFCQVRAAGERRVEKLTLVR